MTDLKDKTVSDLIKWAEDDLSCDSLHAACYELSGRLEEAQKQIVELNEQIGRWQKGYNTLSRSWYEAEIARLKQRNAAHDAEVAAKAKAEALEELAESHLVGEFVKALCSVKAAEYRATAKG